MNVYETTNFKVFKMKVNGKNYYFVGSKEKGGYLFVWQKQEFAVENCIELEKQLTEGTLII